ncbi:helix-turn-helix domain-containing protein [uncultured Ramlibacter sp.]|uniref:helix-turn-helix domain-containing protein n=1 Tax=uncultured Ramlibacter sp. TaxID=260755 RepID=UPI00262D74A0|nr:helix-turn-helix domain-containing protein [uncultured Ramlibacter sp.]
MTLKVRVLRNHDDYEAAMQRMSALMDLKRPSGSDAQEEFDLLRLVIADFEAKHTTEPSVTPVQAIEFRMQQQKLTRKDLEQYIGSQSKVSEVMTGKRPLSIQMIRRLHNALGIPARALIAEAADLEQTEVDMDIEQEIDRFPLKEMHERGLVPKLDVSAKKAREAAAAAVKEFLHGLFLGGKQPALLRAPLFQSGARTMDDHALLVWRASALLLAREFAPKGTYKPGVITDSWLRKLAKQSRHIDGPTQARHYLSLHGIALVVVPRFKKTYLDGAAMMHGKCPIVALTLRHDRLDNFWFALLHEVVHIQKHVAQHAFIADNLDDKTRGGQAIEDEADAGAQEALIPADMWQCAAVRETYSAEDAIALAKQAEIHPCIVAGRVRHETGNWRLLSSLITAAGSVQPYFQDQLNMAAIRERSIS